MTGAQRGIQRERQLRLALERDGWWTMRAAGSLGCCDIVALKTGVVPQFIEVKSTAGGPYERFGPAKRQALLDAAEGAGARAVLVWWPANDGAHWIHPESWPKAGT
jgi:Holliday junction resolvase